MSPKELMKKLGLVRNPPERKGEIWESETPCKGCGAKQTFDDGSGYTCAECGMWRGGLSWKRA